MAIVEEAVHACGEHHILHERGFAEVVRVLASGGLGNVRLNGHATRDYVGSHAATGCVLGRSGTAESLSQLLDQSLSNIVHSNVYSVSNTQDDQRSLARVG